MTDIITTEIARAPVPITIGGKECTISYPMHNLFVFKHASGLSLFRRPTRDKLDFEEDYDAWISCLWAGLHARQDDGTWVSPFTRAQLDGLIDFGNAPDVHAAMFQALANWMPRKKDPAEPQNDEAPEKKIVQTTTDASSNAPGSEPAAVSASAAPSF